MKEEDLQVLVMDYNSRNKEGKSKEERFELLSVICKYQLNILNKAEKIRLLNEKDSD